MRKRKAVWARSTRELAEVLGLADADRVALEVQLELTERIALEAVSYTHLTLPTKA